MAREQLPSGHPDVTRIQFLYGDFRGNFPTLNWDAVRAYVVFTFGDASRLAVPVTLFEGRLTAEAAQSY